MTNLEQAANDMAAAFNQTPEEAKDAILKALEGVGDGPGDWPHWELRLWTDVASWKVER